MTKVSDANRQSTFNIPCSVFIILAFAFVCDHALAEENNVDVAIEKGLAIVQKAAKNYPSHRQCFSCHHQTLPLLAMNEAQAAGFEIEDDVAKVVTDHTFESFHSRVAKLRQGRGIGGRANTVSYGLWTLALADHDADETTAAMVEFLVQEQRDDGRWAPPSNRPPLEESQTAVTVLSAYYMSQFAIADQREDAEKSIAKARHWLSQAEAKSQEDLNFQLWGCALLSDGKDVDVQKRQTQLRERILAAQRDDGGWSQIDGMESDAYATGQTLFVLAEAGATDNSAVEAATAFLVKSQQDDGSWLVETRSKPVQVFFDNGDPHGKSQFISVAATSWAVAALARVRRGQQPQPLPR